MFNTINKRFNAFLAALVLSTWVTVSMAAPATGQVPLTAMPGAMPVATQPSLTPIPPDLDANGFVLMDANSSKILAAKNSDQRMEPASLTKMMTSYIVSVALRTGRIHMND